jgi:hypothetical protein
MIKKILLLVTIIMAGFYTSEAQKVKLSGDEVLVDKVKKFDIVHPLNKKGKDDRNKMFLKDLQGQTVLEVRDSFYYYTKLYYERGNRIITPAFYFHVPSLGKSGFSLPVHVTSLKHTVIDGLEDIGFFAGGEFTNELFEKLMVELRAADLESLVAEGKSVDARRIVNAEASSKKFGEFQLRTIYEKTDQIVINIDPMGISVHDFHPAGSLKVKSNTNYSKTWSVIDNTKDIIAEIYYIRKENKVNVRTFVDDKLESFPAKSGVTEDILLQDAGRYLVLEGYL